MMAILFWASHLLTGGTADLGDDGFDVREAASARLEGWGLAALPCVLAGERSEDCEVRMRCQRLAGHALRGWDLPRLAVLSRAYGYIYDHADPNLDPYDGLMLMDGGPELWGAIRDLGVAEGLLPPESPALDDPFTAYNFTIGLRCAARGIINGQSNPEMTPAPQPVHKLP